MSRLAVALAVLAIIGANGPGVALAQSVPELPRAYVDTAPVTGTGRTISVAPGGDLQSALNTAQPGDTIALAPGAAFSGNFTLPAKTGAGWIVIRSAAPDASLPPAGTRMTPSYSAVLAKLISPNSAPALATEPGAHHYRIVGVEFTVAPAVTSNNGLILLGTGVQTSLDQVPHDIVLDRVFAHGNATVNLRRAVALNSAATAVVDSYLSEAHDRVYDAQAICGWNGPGPFKIVNNYLEGSGENAMFGGGDPAIPNIVPSDIEIRHNHFAKPLSWRMSDPSYAGVHWVVKNLIELKNAQRVLIDGNVFERNWADAQNGFGIVFTVRNQDGGAPWAVVQDVTFTMNVLRHAGAGVTVLGFDDVHPSQRTRRVLIRNNVFEDIDGARWGGPGRLLQIVNGTAVVVVEHVTALQTGDVLAGDLAANTGFVFRNNIARDNGYGVVATGSSLANLATYFPGAVVVDNALPEGRASDYPAGNFYPASLADVGFVDVAGGDYQLAPSSPYRAAGTDGTDLGADIDAIEAATAGVISGVATDTAAPTISITAPLAGGVVSGTVSVTGAASDDTGVASLQFSVDGVALGGPLTAPPYTTAWNSGAAIDGVHTISAVARDAAGNTSTASITVTSANAGTPAAADLVVTALGNPPPALAPGGAFAVTDTVKNQGNATAAASRTQYYLSPDATRDAADFRLTGSRAVPILAAGASSTGTVTVAVPSTVPLGTYTLLACADDLAAVAESNDTNNCTGAAGTIRIARPDLVVSSVVAPPYSAPAATLSVTDTVRNQGAVTAKAVAIRYYLSADPQKSAGDILLIGSGTVPTLAPGASVIQTVTVTVPATVAIGAYSLIACTDDTAALLEADESNNCTASPAPVQVTRADLSVAAVGEPPSTARPGGTFPVADTVRNQGLVAARSSATRYYLSTDQLRSSTARLLTGSRAVGSLAAGAVSSGTVTVAIPSTLSTGAYFLLACADDTNAVAELDEANNCRASVGRVTVAP